METKAESVFDFLDREKLRNHFIKIMIMNIIDVDIVNDIIAEKRKRGN